MNQIPCDSYHVTQPLSAEAQLCLELGKSLQAYGIPAHRFEDTMARISRRFGIDGHFFALPTGFLASFVQDGVERTLMQRGLSGDVNLEKLSILHEITDDVLCGRLNAREASAKLRKMQETPARFRPVVSALAYGWGSATAARFFGGSWTDIGLSCVLGLIVGSIGLLISRQRTLVILYPSLAAVVVAFFALVFSMVVPFSSPQIMTLASLIIMVPGLGLIIAMNEVATANLVAGTSRIAGVAMVFLQLAFGVALGQHLAANFGTAATLPHIVAPAWTLWIALILWPPANLVLFQARPRDLGWIMIACLIGFWGGRIGAIFLGPVFGAGFGAWVLGCACNLISRLRNRPSAVTLLPGLILLVPGSVGFRSLDFVFQKQTLAGIDTAFQMIFLAVSLLTGLLLANVTVRTDASL